MDSLSVNGRLPLMPGVTFEGPGTITPIGARSIDTFTNVVVGTDVYLFGYPSSIGLAAMSQLDSMRPLMRRGIVAGLNYHPTQRLVLDCPSYPGNSGGQVLEKVLDGNIIQLAVIGIVTECVPFAETWENRQFGYSNHTISNSGYSIAEPIDAILALLSQ
jgi:uncharacterized protein (DUF39 family)